MPICAMGVNGRVLTGDVTVELPGDDRKRGCLFSINLILSVHTYALLFPQDGWVLANFLSIFMDRDEN